jgi:hypothetical protein
MSPAESSCVRIGERISVIVRHARSPTQDDRFLAHKAGGRSHATANTGGHTFNTLSRQRNFIHEKGYSLSVRHRAKPYSGANYGLQNTETETKIEEQRKNVLSAFFQLENLRRASPTESIAVK